MEQSIFKVKSFYLETLRFHVCTLSVAPGRRPAGHSGALGEGAPEEAQRGACWPMAQHHSGARNVRGSRTTSGFMRILVDPREAARNAVLTNVHSWDRQSSGDPGAEGTGEAGEA